MEDKDIMRYMNTLQDEDDVNRKMIRELRDALIEIEKKLNLIRSVLKEHLKYGEISPQTKETFKY